MVAPSLSRESKLIESIFPIGIWWICLGSLRPPAFWSLFHRIQADVTSVQITLHFRRSILSMKPNQTSQSWWPKTHLRERDTLLSMPFWFYLTKVMTLFVPRLEYNLKSKFPSRSHSRTLFLFWRVPVITFFQWSPEFRLFWLNLKLIQRWFQRYTEKWLLAFPWDIRSIFTKNVQKWPFFWNRVKVMKTIFFHGANNFIVF